MVDPSTLGKALYWICPALCAGLFLAAWILWNSSEPDRKFSKEFLLAPFVALLLAWNFSASTPAKQRVLWDEAVIYATSLSMHFGHTAYMPTMMVPTPAGPIPVQLTVDKRPPLFPYIGSVMHSVLGASERSLFLVNLLLLFGLFLLVSWAVTSEFGPVAGVAAPVLMASSPILGWVATSGSMDLLGAVSAIGFIFVTGEFLRKPGASGFAAVALTGLFAAYTRYESVAIVAMGLIIALRHAGKQKLLPKARPMLALFLFALLPLLSLLSVAAEGFTETKGGTIFSFANLESNILPFLRGFFQPEWARPFNGWLGVLGLMGLVSLAFRKKVPAIICLMAGASLIQILLALSFFDGHPLSPLSARLYLLPSVALSLAPLLLLGIEKKPVANEKKVPKISVQWALLGAALLLLLYNVEIFRKDPLVFPASTEQLVKERMDSYFAQYPEAPAGALIVWNLNFLAVARGLPAVSPAFFLEKEKLFRDKLANGQLKQVFWIRTPADDSLGLAKEAEASLEKSGNWEVSEQLKDFPSIRILKWNR